jgi:hypothetical protein
MGYKQIIFATYDLDDFDEYDGAAIRTSKYNMYFLKNLIFACHKQLAVAD